MACSGELRSAHLLEDAALSMVIAKSFDKSHKGTHHSLFGTF